MVITSVGAFASPAVGAGLSCAHAGAASSRARPSPSRRRIIETSRELGVTAASLYTAVLERCFHLARGWPERDGRGCAGYTSPERDGRGCAGYTSPERDGRGWAGYTSPERDGRGCAGYTSPERDGRGCAGHLLRWVRAAEPSNARVRMVDMQ